MVSAVLQDEKERLNDESSSHKIIENDIDTKTFIYNSFSTGYNNQPVIPVKDFYLMKEIDNELDLYG